MEIKIVIPSHLRAKNVASKTLVSDPILCVAESEKDLYSAYNPDVEIVTHTEKGLGHIRQWIYEKFGNVFTIDDDCTKVAAIWSKNSQTLDPKQVRQLIVHSADITKELGVYMFGFALLSDPRIYHWWKPIIPTGWVTGSAHGLLKGSKIRYWLPGVDLCGVNEDILASCLNAYYHRIAYIDQRYAFHTSVCSKLSGGLAEVRTNSAEEQSFLELNTLFGSALIRKQYRRNGRNNIGKFLLHLPY